MAGETRERERPRDERRAEPDAARRGSWPSNVVRFLLLCALCALLTVAYAWFTVSRPGTASERMSCPRSPGRSVRPLSQPHRTHARRRRRSRRPPPPMFPRTRRRRRIPRRNRRARRARACGRGIRGLRRTRDGSRTGPLPGSSSSATPGSTGATAFWPSKPTCRARARAKPRRSRVIASTSRRDTDRASSWNASSSPPTPPCCSMPHSGRGTASR